MKDWFCCVQAGGDEGGDAQPPRPELLRFGAHLALALVALELIPAPHDPRVAPDQLPLQARHRTISFPTCLVRRVAVYQFDHPCSCCPIQSLFVRQAVLSSPRHVVTEEFIAAALQVHLSLPVQGELFTMHL